MFHHHHFCKESQERIVFWGLFILIPIFDLVIFFVVRYDWKFRFAHRAGVLWSTSPTLDAFEAILMLAPVDLRLLLFGYLFQADSARLLLFFFGHLWYRFAILRNLANVTLEVIFHIKCLWVLVWLCIFCYDRVYFDYLFFFLLRLSRLYLRLAFLL